MIKVLKIHWKEKLEIIYTYKNKQTEHVVMRGGEST